MTSNSEEEMNVKQTKVHRKLSKLRKDKPIVYPKNFRVTLPDEQYLYLVERLMKQRISGHTWCSLIITKILKMLEDRGGIRK